MLRWVVKGEGPRTLNGTVEGEAAHLPLLQPALHAQPVTVALGNSVVYPSVPSCSLCFCFSALSILRYADHHISGNVSVRFAPALDIS